MFYQEYDILQALCCGEGERSQRDLARKTGCSLGIVNRSLQAFRDEGLVDGDYRPTEKAVQLASENRTERKTGGKMGSHQLFLGAYPGLFQSGRGLRHL